MHVYTDFCKCFFQFLGFVPDVHWVVDAWVIFSCIQRRPIMYTMLATILHNSPNIFLTADDASVTISLIVISFSCRYLMARLTASLSILGECSETSRLSTVSMCTIVPESISRSVYVQYLTLFPGESHLPSPANETVLLWYSSISFSLDEEKYYYNRLSTYWYDTLFYLFSSIITINSWADI